MHAAKFHHFEYPPALADAFLWSQRERIVAVAARHRLPAMYAELEFTESGGLMAYGPSVASVAMTRRERAALYVQSRIHSRSGRRFAMFIAKFHLPAATINLVVQALIPPPKYRVERLVPHVAQAIREHGIKTILNLRGAGDGKEHKGSDPANHGATPIG